MFAVLITALLCLVSVAHSDDAPCEDLVRRDLGQDNIAFDGMWAIVAASLNDTQSEKILSHTDSVTIFFHGSTYTRVDRRGENCHPHPRSLTIENNLMKLQVGNLTYTGTFFQTSCQDCVLMTMEIKSDNYKTVHFYLISRNRSVETKVLDEFKHQAQCWNLPAPLEMDPTKELCPEQVDSKPDTEEA